MMNAPLASCPQPPLPEPAMHAPRRLFCLLGLPFDALTMAETEHLLRARIAARRPGILSTPNLNWVATASRDAQFRQSVLASDCSVVDGMPLVWLARLLGLPCRERVSGSDLMERLHAATAPIRVYFMGGLGDVAARATRTLAGRPSGLVAVGSCNPGQGSVDDMSAPALIRAINEASPDFLVVSLGALKGQAWIMRNRADLAVPWISHLGAVVNFFAGEVRRAPSWLAAAGLEWCWRILQEPNLWRRYWSDGKTVLYLLCWKLLPNLVRARLSQHGVMVAASQELKVGPGDACLVRLAGDWGDAQAPALAGLLERALAEARGVVVDLSGVSRLGNAVIAQLMVGQGRARLCGLPLSCRAPSATARYSLMAHCADYLLESPT